MQTHLSGETLGWGSQTWCPHFLHWRQLFLPCFALKLVYCSSFRNGSWEASFSEAIWASCPHLGFISMSGLQDIM